MSRSYSLILLILLLCFLTIGANGQHVYERGTFVSFPAGKHVNHSYYSTWNVYFAVEDGVIVYNHHKGEWLEPITASNGLSQYPVLLVWQNAITQDVWMVTPDYVFVYDELAGWMSRVPLPVDPNFSGSYDVGISDTYVIVSASSPDSGGKYSALFSKTAGSFELWGANQDLDIVWENVDWIHPISPGLNDIYESLPVQTVEAGSFDSEGKLHLDGHPRNSLGEVSSLTGERAAGESFLCTYGMGIFHQDIIGGDFTSLPYGLLSPDIMAMNVFNDQLVIGGRAGLTYMDSTAFEYDEAIRDIAFDYSFITDIDVAGNHLLIAGRGGVFRASLTQRGWDRVISTKDLTSKRVYSIAAGSGGNLMVATERNAYLFHESGLILRTLFPIGLDWPVFDVQYEEGQFYLSTYYGLYVYDEVTLGFTLKVNSSGNTLPISGDAAIDPIYESVLVGDKIWASTHRGLMVLDFLTGEGAFHLSPSTPFKPRGLTSTGKSVWIGTDIGLYSFNAKSSSWRHYTVSDGLISNFVTELITREGYIWVGTNLGLTRIKWKNLY
ncbi:MAG: hypothetical protein H8E26_09260 [FCB group bacterium]|nr:hypothetical protein [FCB group bacterium]MBL7029495.1 hypothetical protein [Candidatus Neomarinimicrobiota bacterium]MBL7122007.1 hypothetical protein [Candidatus Neomarinimicrobiota bacterium]